jgi:hypothetical protein
MLLEQMYHLATEFTDIKATDELHYKKIICHTPNLKNRIHVNYIYIYTYCMEQSPS